MTASLIVVALGAVIAALGTGALTARCARTPRLFLLAWTAALFSLAVSLAAQTLGYLAGYTELMFRSMELGAQAIAPLCLCLGLVELIAKSLPGRFAMRLAVVAIGVNVLVILGNDPLNPGATLSSLWPDPAGFYQLIPNGLIEFLAVFAAVTALACALVAMARAGRGPSFEEVVSPAMLAAAAAVLLALPGVMMLGQVRLASTVFALAGSAAAGLTWAAASTASRRGLADQSRGADGDQRRRAGSDEDRPGRVDDYLSPYRRTAGSGHRFGGPDADLSYPALAALAAERSDSLARPGADRHDSGQYDSGQYDSGQYDSGQYDAAQYDSGEYDSRQFDSGRFEEPPSGALEPYGHRAGGDRHDAMPADSADPPADLFGQITIYTLLDDRLEDFDRMTEDVVEQVRSQEPGTLVYIVHAVPTAPMQRILYEVYRDRAAYEEHLAQPYLIRYAAERRSIVLATNTIELGLQKAKISPLPSYSAISDLLSESGIDLTGVTKSSRGATAAPAGRHGGSDRHERPAPGTGRYDQEPGEPGYEGWARLRDEDPWYR